MVMTASLLTGCGSDTKTTPDSSGVTGRVTLGPQCPVEIQGQPCADQPAAGVKVTVAKKLGGEKVASTTTNADGSYRVSVEPGDYVVTADAGMSCEEVETRVTASAFSTVDVPCDTGIR